ncbi:hypothetical protein B5807_02955 [Epicoccum nigrum]|uniref:Uncharacterized protein n=1 Tax=Epicoccum nigrum TaxID=105696 RepID=A0A1Y2M954_EPING|nr:hypothetical protein B5807_02955 [Epicoccum nigrum]
MNRYRTTKLVNSTLHGIPLFWFVPTSEEQRANTELALNDVVEQLIKKDPELKKKRIASVPWLRTHAPSAEDIFATAWGFEMGEGHVLGFDGQSLIDGTLLVLHCVEGKKPEIGRGTQEATVSVLLTEQLYKYTLAEAFGDCSWTEIPVPAQTLETTAENDGVKYTLPPHIPADTRLREDNIVLFSLIKLTDDEIAALKQEIGDTSDEVVIQNWPNESPASQAETYNIFQCVKPEIPVSGGQTFVMFIDATHLSGPERAPVVVVACESAPAGIFDGSRRAKLEQMQYHNISLHAEHARSVKSLWPLIWHPPNRGSVNDVVVNYPLFYGPQHRHSGATSSTPANWNDPVVKYQYSFIAAPGLAVCTAGAAAPEYVVFIFSPVTPEEIRILRRVLRDSSGGSPLLLELDIVRRTTRDDDEPTQKSRARLDPLLEFFDTPAYRAVADPPSLFVFLDNEALDSLLPDAGDNPYVPMATTHRHYHHGDQGRLIAEEELLYQFANFPIDEGVDSVIANIETGNMWFWELVGCYEGELELALWPEYRGSITKDMLDIDFGF